MRRNLVARALVLCAMLNLAGCTSRIEVFQAFRPLDMGIDAGAIDDLAARGIDVEYGVVWIGAWNLESGWHGTQVAMQGIVAANATPLIQFYYWGDDLSPECFEVGCYAGTTWKHRDAWWQVAEEFVAVARASVPEQPIVIVVESEFNKNGMHQSASWDAALAEITLFLREQLPHARLVLGFGNWGDGFWKGFDLAVAASHAVGLQAMRATTIDDPQRYQALPERTVAAAKTLQDAFGKPVFLHDVALSSYPEPDGLVLQTNAMRMWGELEPELANAGVEAFVYRSYWDTPASGGYFGPAERHWGLAWPQNGTAKPALEAWTDWATSVDRRVD